MKSVTLPLASGREITLFIGTQHLLVQQTMNVNTCKVIDGLHNNGGWEINLPYSETVKRIAKALQG